MRIAGKSRPEAAAQFGDRGDAVAAVEMIVDQEAVRLEAAGVDRRQRLGEVGRGQHAAAPAAQ